MNSTNQNDGTAEIKHVHNERFRVERGCRFNHPETFIVRDSETGSVVRTKHGKPRHFRTLLRAISEAVRLELLNPTPERYGRYPAR